MTRELFKGGSMRARLLSGGGWATAGQAVTTASGLVVSVILAHLLRPEAVGAYFLALNVVVVLSTLTCLGLDQAVLQRVPGVAGGGDAGLAGGMVLKGLFFVCVTGLAGALLYLLLGGGPLTRRVFHSDLLAAAALPVAVWVLAATVQRYLAQAYRSLHRIRESVLFGARTRFGGVFSTLAVIAVLGVLLVAFGTVSLSPALLATALSSLVISVWGGARLFLKTRAYASRLPQVQLSGLLVAGLPLLVHTLSEYFTKRADMWMAGIYLTDQVTGLYGAAASLALVASTPLTVVNIVLPPFIGELHQKNSRSRIATLCGLTSGAAILGTAAAAVVFLLFGRQLLTLLFGTFYGGGSTVLLILAVGEIAKVAVGSSALVLMMTGHQRSLMFASIAGGVLAIALGLILGHLFGLMGIAVASAIGVTFQQVLKLLIVRFRLGIWTHARPLLALGWGLRMIRGQEG